MCFNQSALPDFKRMSRDAILYTQIDIITINDKEILVYYMIIKSIN